MLITNHVLAGAVIGLLVRRPAAAAGAGFGSHFALDALPHFGVDGEHLMAVAVPDGLLGLGTIAVIVTGTPGPRRPAVLAGITGSCLPDLDKPGQQFFGRSPFPRWFDRIHGAIQSESPRRFPVEVAGAAALAGTLVLLLRRAAATQPLRQASSWASHSLVRSRARASAPSACSRVS